MSEKKIAVFTIGDIQTYLSVVKRYIPDVKPCSEMVGHCVKTYKFASWGKLEKALAEGYHVYVVTTHSRLCNHDMWWRNLVGNDNIFLAKKLERTTCEWRDFIHNILNLPTKPAFLGQSWMDLKDDLKNYGIKLGQDF